MSFVSTLYFVALQAIFVFTTLLVALRKTIHGVLIFCTDLIIMTLYAILTSFALVAVFLGLTVWSCLLVGQQKEIASRRPGFPSNLFKVQSRSISAPVPPQTLSTRWINHTWNVLHATRFGGISPVVFFLSFFVPALLTCALIHQQNQYEKARESEIHKRLPVNLPHRALSAIHSIRRR
jgi:hypothetical protein